MDITQCYRLLNVESSASNEDISRAFKALALRYHPDKNPQNKEWANEQMTMLNTAYSSVMSYRFRSENAADARNDNAGRQEKPEESPHYRPADKPDSAEKDFTATAAHLYEEKIHDDLVARFIRIREDAKDSLYKYFQYGLYNFHRREDVKGEGMYRRIVLTLRKSYHRLKKLGEMSGDREMLEHFAVFGRMIFDFYRSSECLNIIDSYKDQYEVDAWRMYRKGDELLHQAHRELFFDRHNRGYLNKSKVIPDLVDAENVFKKTLRGYPDSSWAVETAIKLEYISSLKTYYELFFTGE